MIGDKLARRHVAPQDVDLLAERGHLAAHCEEIGWDGRAHSRTAKAPRAIDPAGAAVRWILREVDAVAAHPAAGASASAPDAGAAAGTAAGTAASRVAALRAASARQRLVVVEIEHEAA